MSDQTVDAHAHFAGDTSEAIILLQDLNIKVLNVCVAGDPEGSWRKQAEVYQRLAQSHPARYAWCTRFDPPGFDDPGYVRAVIEGLMRDFADGAVACKVWRNIGMEVRSPSGGFVMVDDPLLEPVFAYLEEAGKTLIMHVGEPRACWLPLDDTNPLHEVLRAHPELHRQGRGLPGHGDLMAARDRVIERHPRLNVIGAHLASLEHDLREIAGRFERYPNFAVDTSARIYSLSLLDAGEVRRFFIEYQDRILFGTDADLEQPHSAMSPTERARALRELRDVYRLNLTYLGTRETVSIRDRLVLGLALPDEVPAKVVRENARRWYPGL